MPPPCQHDPQRPSAGTTGPLSYCRLCWLYCHDPAYRALWDGQQTAARAAPCRHRGVLLREEPCPGCTGQVRLKVFACALHQGCTVARVVAGCACCATCPDHVPASDSAGNSLS